MSCAKFRVSTNTFFITLQFTPLSRFWLPQSTFTALEGKRKAGWLRSLLEATMGKGRDMSRGPPWYGLHIFQLIHYTSRSPSKWNHVDNSERKQRELSAPHQDEGSYIHPHWSGGMSDGKRLLVSRIVNLASAKNSMHFQNILIWFQILYISHWRILDHTLNISNSTNMWISALTKLPEQIWWCTRDGKRSY